MAQLPRLRAPAERAAMPQAVQALSADALLLARLRAAPATGIVHSVFDRVLNIEPERGGLLTLAARDVDDAPDTLVLDIDGWSGSGVARGDPARLGAGAIVLGPIVVATAAAVSWRPVLPRYPAGRDRLDANLAALNGQLHAARACQPQPDATARADQLLEAALHRLAAAWAAGDRLDATTAMRAMIGLGRGLTPSGDDILLGLLAAWHVAGHPCAQLAARAGEMLGDVEHRTNAISAAALRAAAAGRVRESIAALLREIVQGTPGTLCAPLSRVLAIGSSSGADIVRGVAAGFAMATPAPAAPCGTAVAVA